MRPGVLGESTVLVNQFRMRGDADKNARLEAALDGVSDQIVSGGPPADAHGQMSLGVKNAVLRKLLPLGPRGQGPHSVIAQTSAVWPRHCFLISQAFGKHKE